MTDKKENILNAALELFANEGYNTISTSKIAKKAGVSEGLIFRHFGSKKGLLDALVKDAEQKIYQLVAPILFEEDPKKVIRNIIEMPYENDRDDLDYWKLQFQLKWEPAYNNPNKMKPLIDKVTWAFKELGHQKPEHEARLLNAIMESVSISVLRDGLELDENYKTFLLNKYLP